MIVIIVGSIAFVVAGGLATLTFYLVMKSKFITLVISKFDNLDIKEVANSIKSKCIKDKEDDDFYGHIKNTKNESLVELITQLKKEVPKKPRKPRTKKVKEL